MAAVIMWNVEVAVYHYQQAPQVPGHSSDLILMSNDNMNMNIHIMWLSFSVLLHCLPVCRVRVWDEVPVQH